MSNSNDRLKSLINYLEIFEIPGICIVIAE